MLNLKLVLAQLEKQRQQLNARLAQLDSAIAVLSGMSTTGKRRTGKRELSALARARIAAAQRARWAKWKRARKAA
jgi:16S rRNA G1207 methylase RsmC